MADLLDTMLAELAELTQTVADLEQQQEAIRLKLASMRSLQAELLSTADVLNRRRHETLAWAWHGPYSFMAENRLDGSPLPAGLKRP